MKTLEMTKATAPLADYAKDAYEGPVIVTLRGRPVAALMPIENADPQPPATPKAIEPALRPTTVAV